MGKFHSKNYIYYHTDRSEIWQAYVKLKSLEGFSHILFLLSHRKLDKLREPEKREGDKVSTYETDSVFVLTKLMLVPKWAEINFLQNCV